MLPGLQGSAAAEERIDEPLELEDLAHLPERHPLALPSKLGLAPSLPADEVGGGAGSDAGA
jgi:hypothetical protein